MKIPHPSPTRWAMLLGLFSALAGCASPVEPARPFTSAAFTTPSGGSALSAFPALSMNLSKVLSKTPPGTDPSSSGSASAQGWVAPDVNVRTPANLDTLGPDTGNPLPENDPNPGTAVGSPTDPLRPDIQLDFSDQNAHRDLWSRLRQGFSLPSLETELVGNHERWYAGRPDYVLRMTDRGGRYLFHVVEEVEKRRMPAELALLPFIESAFNPQAMSSARASGIWQFMPATGKDFELRQNLFRDDRRDVLASTRAALDYLQRLHKQFGDWNLALAAYNWGEGNLQKAIHKNLRAGLPTDYLSLSMPPETRNYVPKLQAVRNIVSQPQAHGLTLTPIENHPYFVSVPIQRDMDVSLASRLAQLPLAEFQSLNPSMNKPVILAAGTPQILLPYENAGKFLDNLPRYKGNLATWTAWVVPHTMKPGEAARQVGTSEQSLRSINLIPDRMLVKAGSTLLVPRSAQHSADVSEKLADTATMQLAPDLPPLRRMSVMARRGDTLASLARRHKVSEAQVAQWNKLRTDTSFRQGQSLVIYVPQGTAQTRRVAGGRSAPPSTGVHAASSSKPLRVAGNPRGAKPAARTTVKVRLASSR